MAQRTRENITDVDFWNISTQPEDLIGKYLLMDTIVHLTLHAPTIKDHNKSSKWTFVGRAGFWIRISPEYKDQFFDKLVELGDLILYKSKYGRSFIDGSQLVIANLVVKVIVVSSVPEIRLNVFAIDDIWLFKPKPKSGKTRQYELYPMLLELGRGVGSVGSEDAVQDEITKIKVYGRLVHALKSTSAKHLVHGPQQTRTWHNALAAIENKAAKTESNGLRIGGYRVELSITTSTIEKAMHIAIAFPYFYGFNAQFQLDVATVKPADYYAYVEKMVYTARQILNIRLRHDQIDRLTKLQARGVIDVANALGWNPGKRRCTAWNDLEAWWLEKCQFTGWVAS
ncbi:hypothetical protein PCANC_18685 [Puccinia coronata f. sp. avenae]|uniref:Uncharacterized protein n=1 Tax=Puccinia coronata f. sp. avenae TaxID=200324 RepID=A0A2N5VCB0_9BASI|nr:hypothetical protein PCANC_18685 [Puccinia coronata f. sp. avenae]